MAIPSRWQAAKTLSMCCGTEAEQFSPQSIIPGGAERAGRRSRKNAHTCLCFVESSGAGEDVDDIIVQRLSHLAQIADGACLALLAADVGYADLVRNIVSAKREITVFVPRSAVSSVLAYQENWSTCDTLGENPRGS